MIDSAIQTDADSAEQAATEAETQCDLFIEHSVQAETQTANEVMCDMAMQTEELEEEGRKSVSDVEIFVETPRPRALDLTQLPKPVGCVNETPIPEEELAPESPLLVTTQKSSAYAWGEEPDEQTNSEGGGRLAEMVAQMNPN